MGKSHFKMASNKWKHLEVTVWGAASGPWHIGWKGLTQRQRRKKATADINSVKKK